ncbi:MAG: pyridoxamine 5'-phosphate oxidase family protein [Candidatus Bathyarchaeota archaeon]|nr:pyridoxamine 5'-phosphate oxidase family protein [Candidatus Bathyarchaeota archaeon]
MEFKDCIKFANDNPMTYVATLDGNQPRVRGFMMWYANESGFYFHTGATKPVYKQMKANPNVELCFYHPDEKGGVMMRVAGAVEFIDDKKLRGKLVEERQFLKAWGFTAESSDLIIFKVSKGEAYFWTMETNFDAKKAIKFG